MKSIFLHGAIGKAFGEKFQLDVSTPREALRALLAVNDGMKKYLIDKESKGIHYGIKKKDEFIQQGEEDFNLTSDFHIAPIPAGGATFALNLAMMAASTAMSMIVNKKMAETMKQDNETLTMQTQSYIYNGKSNHMKQGQVIPFGYGRMIVGSSVVSSSVINYEWHKDKGKILFIGGPFGLLPKTHPYSGRGDYPWVDFALYRSETHMTEEEKTKNTLGDADPVYKILKESAQTLIAGVDSGGYNVPRATRARPSWLRKEGNAWTGYTLYEYIGPFGGNEAAISHLPNYNKWKAVKGALPGNWGSIKEDGSNGYKMNQSEADSCTFTAIQSIPILETEASSAKEFYPILFINDPGDKTASPALIGQRYKNGDKEEGLGWYAFESVSIQKNIDMICEGPIEGFSDNQGNTLEYKTEPSNTPQVTVQYQGQTINMREENNDFLQAVKLNDIPVKEIKNGLDSFNFNEFDIDIGRDESGKEIGGHNQKMLEPQYRFISSTKDTQGQLFGYRKTNVQPSSLDYTIKEFKENFPFQVGDYIKDTGKASNETWVVARDLSTEWKEGIDYQKGNSLVSKIVYVENSQILI